MSRSDKDKRQAAKQPESAALNAARQTRKSLLPCINLMFKVGNSKFIKGATSLLKGEHFAPKVEHFGQSGGLQFSKYLPRRKVCRPSDG
jgi:hypothetical protein